MMKKWVENDENILFNMIKFALKAIILNPNITKFLQNTIATTALTNFLERKTLTSSSQPMLNESGVVVK